MNIVILSTYDYAGSGWRIAQAIRKYTNHNVLHVITRKHQYGYQTDYTLNRTNIHEVARAIEKADIIHFKGDEPPVREWHGLRIPDRKIVVTVGGSAFRRKKWPINRYVDRSDLRTALSPDLNYPEFKSYYTPYVIHSEKEVSTWSLKTPFKIGYYASSNKRKGVESHVLPALEVLKKEYPFEVVRIKGMSYEESLNAKKNLTILIEQISVAGCYGNSGVEAMQFGVPVIAYLSERSLEQAKGTQFVNSPVLNPGPKIGGLVDLLRKILSKKIDLEKVSKDSKEYCDSFHGYRSNAKLWDKLYKSLFEGLLS